eukprot:COSAG02_NODE_5545_length_4243_cov_2.175193_5_plen_70_part_00
MSDIRLSVDSPAYTVTVGTMHVRRAMELAGSLAEFNSAVVLCGGGDAAMARTLRGTPLWILHAANDVVV